MSKQQKKWMLIVNLLTISRLVGAILLFPIYFKYNAKVVSIVFMLFFLTDSFDGILARKYNVSTFFGGIMDSIADKLMAISACIILCFINSYMIYSILIEVLIVVVNTLIFTQKGNIQSSYIGKIKTWILPTCIVIGLLVCKESTHIINIIVAAPAIIFGFITLYMYVRKLLQIKVKVTINKPQYKSFKEIKHMLFDPEFYKEYKDKTGLITHIYKNEK